MLIDFSKIEEVRVPNFKGGEKELLKKARGTDIEKLLAEHGAI